MSRRILPALVAAALAVLGTAWAAGPGEPRGPMPRGPGGPPPGRGVPSAERLATVDGLGAAQQTEVRRILRERRDAEDALRSRLRGEREAIDQRERTERERIEDQTTQKLRNALGEDGYRAYAQWATSRGPEPRPPQGPRGERSDVPPAPPTP
jgi:hypothetical protein